MIYAINAWEVALLERIGQISFPAWLDVVSLIITFLGGYGVVWLLSGSIFLFFTKHKAAAIAMLIGFGMTIFLSDLVFKEFFYRPRPFETVEWLYDYVRVAATGNSFPSGHASRSMAAASAFFFSSKSKWRWAFLGMCGLIGLSRVYQLVHYPTDILVGWTMGILVGLLAAFIAKKGWNWYENRYGKDTNHDSIPALPTSVPDDINISEVNEI